MGGGMGGLLGAYNPLHVGHIGGVSQQLPVPVPVVPFPVPGVRAQRNDQGAPRTKETELQKAFRAATVKEGPTTTKTAKTAKTTKKRKDVSPSPRVGGVKKAQQAPKSRKGQKSKKIPATSSGGRAGGSGGGAPPAFTKQRSRHYAQSIYKGVCGKSKTKWTWRCKVLPPKPAYCIHHPKPLRHAMFCAPKMLGITARR